VRWIVPRIAQAAYRAQEGFLGEVIGGLDVGEVRDESPYVTLGSSNELLEGGPVAGPGCHREGGQLFVGRDRVRYRDTRQAGQLPLPNSSDGGNRRHSAEFPFGDATARGIEKSGRRTHPGLPAGAPGSGRRPLGGMARHRVHPRRVRHLAATPTIRMRRPCDTPVRGLRDRRYGTGTVAVTMVDSS
jgi:hypothetical protein